MILLDPRVGSKHLAADFENLGAGFEITHLEYADASFIGLGPDDEAVTVGVEVKNVQDLANSMQSGRLAGHQIPGLLDTYQHVWLVVEGIYRRSRGSSVVEIPRGAGWYPLHLGRRPVFWSQLENFLTSLEALAGIHMRHTRTSRETAEFIHLLHDWWQKPDHKSLKVIHRPAPRAELARLDDVTRQIRDIAGTLPGIGYDRAMAIAKACKSPADLFMWTDRDFQKVPGVGRTLAKRIVASLHGEKGA